MPPAHSRCLTRARKHPNAVFGSGFAIASLTIVLVSGAATATVALNTVGGIAAEVFPAVSHINAPKGLVTDEYSGGPQTFLVLGSDRRAKSKDTYDASDPPHSDTILLVRFDPDQGQTSVMSIPRDLKVNITTPSGQVFENEKINAAYTLGAKLGGSKEATLLAAETVEHEVFPGLHLNGIVDVNFAGFIKVVDTLGCAYVNVDHRYYNENVGSVETDYTSINLQPGYQKLCYENALDYVRYRHTDSDFVRVAAPAGLPARPARAGLARTGDRTDPNGRQSRRPRDQHHVPGVGERADRIDEAGRLLSDQAAAAGEVPDHELGNDYRGRLVRHLRPRTRDEDAARIPARRRKGRRSGLPRAQPPPLIRLLRPPREHQRTRRGALPDLILGRSRSPAGGGPGALPGALPGAADRPGRTAEVRPYVLFDQQNHLHHAYVIVWKQNPIGGYYDFEGSDWLNPPLFAHARTQVIDGREYRMVDDGSHIHVIGWRSGNVLYWLTNTLLEELTNGQMIAIARSAHTLH